MISKSVWPRIAENFTTLVFVPGQTLTLADANENRDWRIYSDFAQSLIQIARPLYAETDLGLDLKAAVYALDATTIDLCLSLFPWARFRRAKGAVKLHTMIDLQRFDARFYRYHPWQSR